MKTRIAHCTILTLVTLSVTPARASLLLAEIHNRASYDRTLIMHFVGASADGHRVDATISQNGLDTTLLPIGDVARPGETIPLLGVAQWGIDLNQGLTVDGTSYPAGSPPFVFPTLAPTGDGIHGEPAVNAGFFDMTGTALAPAAPQDPTVAGQLVTVQASFTYTQFSFMESLVDPHQLNSDPLLVAPLFYFNEPGGSGIVDLTLYWLPTIGAWEGIAVDYHFSITPEPHALILAAFALAGLLACGWRRRSFAAID